MNRSNLTDCTRVTLVTGRSGALREAAIAAALTPGIAAAVILEGLPDGSPMLEAAPHPPLAVARIAPGCLCCTGNLTLRVTLHRLLRRQPAQLYIGLATAAHLPQLRAMLQQPPYAAILSLTQELHA